MFDLTGPFYDTGEGTADAGGGPSLATAIETEVAAGSDSPDAGSGDSGTPPTEAAPADAGTTPKISLEDETTWPKGWLPLARHEAVLGKARSEGSTALERTGWARDLDREETQRAISEYQHRQRDPRGYAQHVYGSVQQDEAPAPDRHDSAGNVFYSPEQAAALAQYQASQAVAASEARFEARFGPIEKAHQDQQVMSAVDGQVATAQESWPLFNDHIGEISEVVAAANAAGQRVSLRDAYEHVVYPKLLQSRDATVAEVRAALLAEMQTAPVNDTDPARSSPAPTVKAESQLSLADELERQFAAGLP